MTTSKLAILTLSVVVLISLVAIRFYPSFQAYMANNATWNGIKDFTTFYHVKVLTSLENLPSQSPPNTLFLIPQRKLNEEDLTRVKNFVVEGNRLVVMDESGYGNEVMEALGLKARFSSADLVDPLFSYKNPSFPRISDFSEELQAAGVQGVVLNHPTILVDVDPGDVEASSSSFSFLDLDGQGTYQAGEPQGPFAVVAGFQVGQGTVQAVPDTSLLMNVMGGENGNGQLIRYLTGIDRGSGVVALDTSHFSTAPLDTAKITFESFRGALASPFVWLGIIVVIFAAVIVCALKREDIFGQ